MQMGYGLREKYLYQTLSRSHSLTRLITLGENRKKTKQEKKKGENDGDHRTRSFATTFRNILHMGCDGRRVSGSVAVARATPRFGDPSFDRSPLFF